MKNYKNILYYLYASVVVLVVALFYNIYISSLETKSFIVDMESTNINATVADIYDVVDSSLKNVYACEKDECIPELGSHVYKVIIERAKETREYINPNLISMVIESKYTKEDIFFTYWQKRKDQNIKVWLDISLLEKLLNYDFKFGSPGIEGSWRQVPNTDLYINTMRGKDYKFIYLSVLYIIILVFGIYLFISVNRKNDDLEIQLISQTMSLTEANKELETERDVFAEGPVIILKWEYGWHWDVTYASPNASDIIGYTYADFMGDFNYDDVIHESDINRIRSDVDDMIKSGETSVSHREFRVTNKDGSLRWVDSNTTMSNDSEGKIHLVSYLVDIDDKMKAFTGLRNQRLAMDQATILSSFNLDGAMTYVNDSFCELSGYSREQLMSFLFEDIYSDRHDEYFKKEQQDKYNSGDIWKGDICYKDISGNEYWVAMTIIPSLTESGNIFEYQAIGFEITEVKEAHDETNRQRALADKANEAKSQFLANMSHELRTPMNGLMGMAELLKNTKLTEQQYSFVDGILYSSDHQLSILNDILDLSKMQSGNMKLETINFNLLEMLEIVVKLFTPTASTKGIELGVIYSHDVPVMVRGDQSRLKQVITNLINNAIKFTHWGKVLIRVNLSDVYPGIKIDVEDTGVGIPEDAKGKLFKEFSQVDETITRKFGGTGLGLSICSYIISAFKGVIYVNSKVGIGSIFTLDIPIAVDRASCLTPLSEGSHVSVVGSYSQVIDVYREILNNASIGYKIFSNLSDVWSDLNDNPVDIIYYIASDDNAEGEIEKMEFNSDITRDSVIVSIDMEYNPDDINAVGIRTLSRPLSTGNIFAAIEDLRSGKEIVKVVQPNSSRIKKILNTDNVILVVDDNKANRDVLELFINSFGGTAKMARDGDEAIKMAREFSFDLVFMDCHMPGKDGFETTKLIHEDKPELPIIMLTADITQEARDQAKEAGAQGFMLKPIKVPELRAAFEKYCDVDVEDAGDGDESHLLDENLTSSVDSFDELNLSSLDLMMDLDYEGTSSIVMDIVGGYNEYENHCRIFVEEGDIEALERVVHKFKGGSLSFATDGIINDYAEMNVYLQEEEDVDIPKVENDMEILLKHSRKYIMELESFLKTKS